MLFPTEEASGQSVCPDDMMMSSGISTLHVHGISALNLLLSLFFLFLAFPSFSSFSPPALWKSKLNLSYRYRVVIFFDTAMQLHSHDRERWRENSSGQAGWNAPSAEFFCMQDIRLDNTLDSSRVNCMERYQMRTFRIRVSTSHKLIFPR